MSDIPRNVLSDAFQQARRGRQLRAAVFLTFQFDPGFFEQEILPVFFDVTLSHVPEIRLLGLAEELRKVDSVAVYYDRAALVAGAQSSLLDIQRVAVSQSTGYFHPKIVLALLDDALLVAALSANLTRSGWWENVEVAHIEEVRQENPCSFRDDLLALISRVRTTARHVDRHDALDAIERFVNTVLQDPQRMRQGFVLPRLFFSDEDITEFLSDIAGNRLQRLNLEILAPFFDDQESALPMERLKRTFHPRAIRIFLPRGSEGQALCSAAYYERIATIAQWSRLPSEVIRLAKDIDRPLHAKVFRFFHREERYEAFFVGSANLTNAALNHGGNVESGFFVEISPHTKPDWWLLAVEDPPPAFDARFESDTLTQGTGWRLTVRYGWSDATADCYWDDTRESPRLTLVSHGVEIAQLGPLAPCVWITLDSGIASKVANALESGSFLTVGIEGEPDAQILVQEEQMTHKPSLLARVTASDILRYWSLLTPEQKKEFLEEHAEAFHDPEVAMWLGENRPTPDAGGIFATFAEIYLSFGNLQRAVRDAIAAGRQREAVERLCGRKFDSLRRLTEKVAEEIDSDPVRRYVVMLCARQVLDVIECEQPELADNNRRDVDELRRQLDAAAVIRKSLAIGNDEERDRFFRWFDRWFLRPAEPLREAAR